MRSCHSLALVLAVALVALSAGVTSASLVHSHVEDFTSTTYLDTLVTTAVWDTAAGEVRLPPFEMEPTAYSGGSYYTRGLDIDGDLLFATQQIVEGRILDITDPSFCIPVGSFTTSIDANGCDVDGDWLYVAAGTDGLMATSVTDVVIPTLEDTYNTPGEVLAVSVSGNVAYIADGTQGAKAIDVSDPTNMAPLGSYFTPGPALGVTVSGDLAYFACGAAGLQVLNVIDPASLSFAGSVDTPGSAVDIATAGNYAYVADSGSGLQVVDITDPTSLVVAGSVAFAGTAHAVAVDGDYAYVAAGTGGLIAVDVTDPTSPSVVGTYTGTNDVRDVVVAGEHAYLADDFGAVYVVKIAEFVGPFLASTLSGTAADGIDVDGDLAFMGVAGGLRIIDVSDVSSPTVVTTATTTELPVDVFVEGDYAFLAAGATGVEVVDISDPGNAALVETHGTYESAVKIVLHGNRAYVADFQAFSGGLTTIDVSDPTSLTNAGSASADFMMDIAVAGDYVYAACLDGEVHVFDITGTPSDVYYEDVYMELRTVEPHGDILFIGGFDEGLILDVSDPTAPEEEDYGIGDDGVQGTLIRGNLLFEATDEGLYVEGFEQPGTFMFSSEYLFPDTRTSELASHGDYVLATSDYSGDGLEGLLVFEVFQRRLNITDKLARSLSLEGSAYEVTKAKLTATQSDSIKWELSVDGGTTWEEVAGDDWHTFAVPGSDLMWRSTHEYAGGAVNPTVTDLRIDWLYEVPAIDVVLDVPNDQGRQARLSWTRSSNDFLGESTPVTEYAIYRRVDEWAGRGGKGHILATDPDRLYPPGDWEFVTTVPASCEDTYTMIVPTVCDSTVSGGMCESTYFVRALTATPGVHFDSPVDSGYSIDNLAPAPPRNLMAGGDEVIVALDWDPSEDADFDYFVVYRDTSALFGTANIIGYTSDVSFDDDDPPAAAEWWYRIAAVDFAGNESEPSESASVTSTGIDGIQTTRFHLAAPVPNPSAGSTSLRYTVPEGSASVRVLLEIFDSSGRLVRSLVDRVENPGFHTAVWDGRDGNGNEAASGVYFCRMTAGEFSDSKKVMMLR